MRESPSQRAWRRFKRNRSAFLSAIFLLISLVFLLIWPAFAAFTQDAVSDEQLRPPGAPYWFGTDVHGRDLLSRVVYGARISLSIGILGAMVSLVIGVLWGAIAGYLGGRVDDLMMRTVDVLYSLPSIVFVIVFMTTLEGWLKEGLQGRFSVDVAPTVRILFLFIGLGAVSWLTMARIVRGQVLALRRRTFVEACKVLGAGHTRIVLRHLLPHTLGIVVVYATLTVPVVVLSESFLSYLGLGIQPPQASLGSLMAEGAAQINPLRVYWWLVALPGATLLILLLALSFVGDGLREAFEARSEKAG